MMSSYVYAETAFHHEGDLDYMLKLIVLAKEASVQGIKFQVLSKPDDFLSTKHSDYNALAGYCFSQEQWEVILQHTANAGLDIIMMPLDLKALELTNSFDIKFLEIHSVSFYDEKLIEGIKGTTTPLIIGVGGRTIDEIKEKQQVFGKQLQVLMLGFQAFPSRFEDVRLGKISILKQSFPALQIGYADHSSFNDLMAVTSNDYARLLGADYFEKHITLREGDKRTDSASAIGLEKMKEIVQRLNFIDTYVLGSEAFLLEMTAPEQIYRDRQKKVVATRTIEPGEQLASTDLQTKMIDKPGGYVSIQDLIGKKLSHQIEADDLITSGHLLQ